MRSQGGNKTFEFDFDDPASVAAGNVAIPIQVGETTTEVAAQIASVVNGQSLTTATGTKIAADAYEGRVMLNGATGLTQSANPTLTTVGDGSGKPTSGVTLLHITSTMAAQQVAQVMVNALQTVFKATIPTGAVVPPGLLSFKVDNVNGDSVVRMIGHTVNSPGPLPYARSLAGDHGDYFVVDPAARPDQFLTAARGQDNKHGGFYIDNIIIGFAERGEMATQAQADPSFSPAGAAPTGQVTAGYYQLQIRKASEYATWVKKSDGTHVLELDNSFDVNDRQDDTYTLIAPPALEIPQGSTFTVGDGIATLTFQFIDSSYPGGDPNNVPVYFSAGDTAADVAAAIVSAVNGAAQEGLFKVTATTNGTSDRVDLFGAVKLTTPVPNISGSTPKHNDVPKGFNENTMLYEGLHVANPPTDAIGTAYLVYGPSAFGGTYSDAEKAPPAANPGVTPGTGDDYMDWAAAASNVLAWTGWGEAKGMTTADQIFKYFQDHWTDVGSWSIDAWIWWFTGRNSDRRTPGVAQVDVAGGGFFRNLNPSDYIQTQEDPTLAMSSLDKFFHNGDGVVLGLQSNDPSDSWYPVSHAVTAWGFTFNANLKPTDPNYYTGVYLTDSDDLASNATSTDQLKYYQVQYSAADNVWYLKDYYGRNTIYIDEVSGLQKRFSGVKANKFTGLGDQNQLYDQGQVILDDNRVTYSSDFGIVVAPGDRAQDATLAKPGPTAPLREVNTDNQVPGVVIENNVLAFGVAGGIHISGDAGDGSTVTFARIVNNTVYGVGPTAPNVGIKVGPNASPTILNNVVANTQAGIEIYYNPAHLQSTTTVVGTTAYSGNTRDAAYFDDNGNLLGDIPQTFPIDIGQNEPLFVNAAEGNFYPAAGSRIIDSSLDSLPDRPNMVTVRTPLGIPLSPILAPDTDLDGQLRIDDPSVSPPSGFGKSTYKDRGAIDRVDFDGPTGALVDPADNDAAGIDHDPTPNNVTIAVVGETTIGQFSIQLSDAGVGIDDSTVAAADVQLLQNGEPLTLGSDYFFIYDPTNHTITLEASAGVWQSKSTYTILLSNAIRDIAGNPLQANLDDGTTKFTVTLADYDFGDAPMYVDAAHTISATTLPDGARHLVVPGVYLGNSVDSETDAHVNSTATGDAGDDGVQFVGGNFLVSAPAVPAGQSAAKQSIVVTASVDGYLDAWIDWNHNGVWDPSEQLAFTDAGGASITKLHAGANTLFFTVPIGLADASSFQTFARFRFSTTGLLTNGQPMQPTGEASDGEVEDYQVTILQPPGQIAGNVWNDLNGNGVHDTSAPAEPGLAGWTVYIDANNNGVLDSGERSTTTGADGSYSFADVAPGAYVVREVAQPSQWSNTGPNGGFYTVTVALSENVGNIDFFNLDLTPPVVVSIVKGDAIDPVVDPTNATLVHFAVTFSKPVTGVDATDFAVVAPTLTGAFIANVAFHDGIYDVVVNTGAGDGSLQLNLVDDDSITDALGNKLGGAGVGNGNFAGQTFTIDKTPPALVSIALASPNPTKAATVAFTVTFSENVTGVDVADFLIGETGLTGNLNPVVTGSGKVYTVTVGTDAGDGTLSLNLVNDGSIADIAGNPLAGELVGSQPYTVDRTAPVVVSSSLAGASPTSATTVDFTVTFSEPVLGVNYNDFGIVSTGLLSPAVLSVSGSGAVYTVTVKTGSGAGTLQIQVLDDNSIHDVVGNLLGGPALHDGDFLTGDTYVISRSSPTSMSLSNARTAEHVASGLTVGVFGSIGPHGGTYTYTLVSGGGSADNASFQIVDNRLVTNAVFDYATKNAYQIRVRTTDSAGYWLEKTFTIAIVPESGTVSVGDLVWNDLNHDGLSAGEPGLPGAVVELFCSPTGTVGGANDYSLGKVVTDGNGNYHFVRLLPELSYYLVFHAPSGYTFTTPNVGADDTIDSDASAAGVTAVFTLPIDSTTTTRNSFDAGLVAVSPRYDFALQAGSTGDDAGQSVATDSSGNVYVAGSFHGTVDFDPGPGVYNLTSAGGSDAFIAKYTPAGALVWARAVGGPTDDVATSIALGPNGNVCIAGGFTGTANFLSGSGGVNLTSVGAKDAFILKLDSAGNFIWARSVGGAGDDVVNSIAIAADGTVYTTGSFQNIADFDPSVAVNNLTSVGPTDAFVAKFDSSGNYVWAKRMGGIGWAQGITTGAGIALAADGSVYTTGSFQGTADFDPSDAQSTLVCAGDTDVFVSKLDSAGNFVWARRMGGADADYGAAIAVAADGSVYTTGGFFGVVDFNPGTATYNLDSAGYHRVFVSKLDSSGNFVWADGVGGTGWDLATGIALGSDGSVYASGGFWGTADFDPGAGVYSLISSGQKDAYILDLTASGTFTSAKRLSGPADDCANGVAVGPAGVVYATGYFQGTADFDPSSGTYNLTSAGGQDLFVFKSALPLTVAINQAPTQADPTTTPPVVFRAVFSSPVADFTPSDVALGGTATGTLVASVTPVGTDGATYDVSVTGMTGSGTITASIAAGQAHNTIGTANATSTSSDNSVAYTYSVVQPVVSNVLVSETTPGNHILESNESLSIGWNVTSPNGIASQTLLLDGHAVTPINGAGGAYTCTIGTFAAGAHSYTITVTDSLGVKTVNTSLFVVYAPAGNGPVISNVLVSETTPGNQILESNESLNITWSATSSNSVASQTIAVDGHSITPINGPYSTDTTISYYSTIGTYAVGTHNYTITATDSLGVKSTSNGSFTVVAPAGVGPAITQMAIGENGAVKNGILESNDPLKISWGATSPNGIGAQSMTVDGTVIPSVAGPYGGLYYISYIGTWSVGTHNYMIQSADTKGNSSTQTGQFTVVAPTVTPPSITAMAIGEDGAVKNGILESNEPLKISWGATSQNGIGIQSMTVDDTVIPSVAGPYGGMYYISHIGTWSAGQHTYRIQSADMMGNSSTQTGQFTVVAATVTPPSITQMAIGEDGAVKNGILESSDPLKISWGATSPNGIGVQTMTVDGTAIPSITGPYGGMYYIAHIGTWSAGQHSYTIQSTDTKGNSSSQIGQFTVAAALMVDASTAPQGSAAVLANSQLAPIASAAISRLESRLGSQVDATLAGVSIKVANLAPGMLGETAGNTIWIDDNGAGYGWFVDPTPGDDAEFSQVSATDLAARPGSPAANHADLLTTVMHEMGHVLGFDHSTSPDLMYPTLPLGERRLMPGSDAATALAADIVWNRDSSNDILDEAFASLNQDGKKDLSWL